ncbi:hypothetical protein AVEN_221812-1, partial [Araneus ventricosus]
MSLAYAKCPLDVRESLAVQFFVDAIRDEDMLLSTRSMDFTDLKSALAYSMKYEASKIALKISMHARPIRIENNAGKRKDEKFGSLLGVLEKLLDRLAAGKRNIPRWNPNWYYKKGQVQRERSSDNASRRNPNATCWKCNKKGHLQNECQQITSMNHHKETRHGKDKAFSRSSFVESCEHDLNSDKKFGTETDISMSVLRMTTEDTWSIITDKPINSEIPAYQAQSFGIQLCSVSQTNSHEIVLPIHLRYQQPHDCKRYGKSVAINLGDAVIYVRTHSDGLSTTNCFHIENDDLWIENKVELKTSFQVPVGCAEDLYI